MDDKDVLQKNFELRFNVLEKFLIPHTHENLFEIGSAYGFFLEFAQSRFQNVQGIDITQEGVRYAQDTFNAHAVLGDFLEYDLGKQQFDVICMWDTIEHLKEPDQYIAKISACMKEGSLLALTTGDINSLNARMRKEKWRLIHPPTHIHYFSQKSMNMLLNRYGLEVIYNRHCAFYRSIDNAAYNLFVLRQNKPYIYNILKKIGLTRISFPHRFVFTRGRGGRVEDAC